jgi:hypothetical protein
MDEFVLGHDSEVLRVVCAARSASGRAERLIASLTAPGLSAHVNVDVSGFQYGYPDIWAEEMQANWGGWEDHRTYRSIQNELQLSALHDGRIILVRVRITPFNAEDWVVSTSIVLEPGEELSALVADIQKVMGPRPF